MISTRKIDLAMKKLEKAEKKGGKALRRFRKYGDSPEDRRSAYRKFLQGEATEQLIHKKCGVHNIRPEQGGLLVPKGTPTSDFLKFFDFLGEDAVKSARETALRSVLGLETDATLAHSSYLAEDIREAEGRTKAFGSVCVACRSAAVSGARILRCSACNRATYCSPGCQKKDWKLHKLECPLLQEAGRKAKGSR